ncbi:thyrotropin-releasing hormone-degrading ectoenzyme-like [Anoplolepis gracilipes]|uniref:thyrotropin-releasing hormone-degrading ectoenzyme-like n=1 Tax=Anoplolepis gracilipes TaxID=354296 RepID=UPI003BA0F94C
MAFLRLLFYSGLIFGTIITFSINENTKNSSIEFTYYFDDIIPVHYDVKLIPYFKEDKEHEIDKYKDYKTDIEEYQTKGNFVFYGELSAIIDISGSFTKIGLNSSTLILLLSGELTSSTIYRKDSQNIDIDVIYSASDIRCDAAKQICYFYFKKTLSSGRYRLNTKFVTAIDSTENIITSLKTIVKRRKSLMMSDPIHFQATGARRLFPCWDKPTIKATFNIFIKHHRTYQVFSNMPVQEEETCKDEIYTETYMKWTCFNTTPLMSTYVVTVVISSAKILKFETEESRIIIWRRPDLDHMEFAEMIATKAMTKFEHEWKELKIPKVQFVAIHSLLYDNENWGLLLNSETDITYDKNLDSVAHKIKVARLIGRNMAYQWFGDVINTFWSSELWLIDGLTTLYGIDAINSILNYENSEMMDLFVVQVYYESLRLETHNQSLIKEANFSENNAFSSFYRYVKAPLILRTLQYVITHKMFQRKVCEYLSAEIKSKTPTLLQNLWIIRQSVSRNPNVKKGQMLPLTILNHWMKSINYPVLKITRDFSNKENVYNITIENYEIFKKYAFWVPVTYTSQNELDFRELRVPYDERLIVLSSSTPTCQVSVKDNGWIIFNLLQSGYYRVNYDPETWQKIAEYLNSTEYTKIHVINRAKIIDDAFYFMINGQLNSSLFWNLTNYLRQETNYIAWYPMIKALEHMSSIIPFPDEGIQNIKEKLKNILANLLEKIKYKEDFEESDLTKCLRQEAIKWLCILGDLNCLRTACNKLLLHIKYMSNTNKLLPWWKEWIYCKGLILAKSNDLRNVKEHLTKEYNNDRFLEFLACASNEIMEEYLESIMLKQSETYNETQIKRNMISFFFVIAKHAKHDNVFWNILENFDKLKPRGVNEVAIFIGVINHVYSEKQLKKIRNFMENIIVIEAYKNYHKRMYKKYGTIPEMATIKASFYKFKNLVNEWMLDADKKLLKRLHEIEEIKKYFKI